MRLALAMVLAIAGGCAPVDPAAPPDAMPVMADEADGGGPAGPDAGASLLSTLTVATDGTAIATPILDSGRTYTIVASGTFKWGNCDAGVCPGGGACGYERLADAFHRTDDCWASTTEAFEFVSLAVDGEQVDWGPYRADHTYSLEVTGAGASLQFRVTDCTDCFGDNAGELEVDVYDEGPS